MIFKNRVHQSEALIQSKLHEACLATNLRAHLQYVINPNQHLLLELHRKPTSVFDLVLVVGDEVVAIVEVKDSSTNLKVVERSEQISKYKKHNIPVYILNSVYDIPFLVKQLVSIRDKFIGSLSSEQRSCIEGDRKQKKKWDEKIEKAYAEFRKAYPSYQFKNGESIQIIATAVRVLKSGLSEVLKIIDRNDNFRDFLFELKSIVKYTENGRSVRAGPLYKRDNHVYTLTSHQNNLNKIDEKLG